MDFYQKWGKRVIDLAVTVPTLLCCLPLFFITALLVKLDSPGPVFFGQDRLGRFGSVFKLYKFRTMTDRPRTATGEIYGAAPDVTRFGYWLRRFKIDELPQLLNVIKGEMSIVGPRPTLPEQLSEYDEVAHKRLSVRPGLTGLAQVNGNIHLSWSDRWKYDQYYVEHLSLSHDISIIYRTIAVVLLGEAKFLQAPNEK